jgi:hypothetical protein
LTGADADDVRAQVERVLTNPLFHNSKRYTNLLRYIVDRTLQGQHDELKERIIGIEVFGRTPDYDTSLDPTVRVAATEVRKRLIQYYNEPGHEQELRIAVPVGSYGAEFRLPDRKQIPQDVVPAPKRRKLQYRYFVAPLAVVLLAFVGWGIKRLLTPVPAIDEFWAPVLNSSGPVLVCIGSPASVGSAPVPPSSSQGSAESGVSFDAFSRQRVNVAMTDVSAANDLAAYLRRKGKDSVVRPAHGTSLSDLRSNPVVLLGSHDNEWASRLGAGLHFRFRREADIGKKWIEDASNPANRNWAVDTSARYEQVDSDYALISRVLDPSTGQWWIGIAGLTGLGTQVAHQVAIDPKTMAAISASLPRDWERKNVQIVLAVKIIQGSPGAAQVVGTYSW